MSRQTKECLHKNVHDTHEYASHTQEYPRQTSEYLPHT